MKHVYKNVGSKHRQDASLRQANSGIVATEKQSYDREHHKQKRARETIPERQQRMQADRERHQQKLVQEITPERQQRRQADRQRREHKLAQEITPERVYGHQ